jgi:hypothetical protein
MFHPTIRSFLALLTLTLTTLAAVAGLAPRTAAAETVAIDCYAAADDADGDGYARPGAPEIERFVDEDKKLYCPGDYVIKSGDCDDTRLWVHPHAPEFPFNLSDEDCDGTADEPALVYFPNGNQNTQTGFSIRVKLASSALVAVGSALAYEVEYADLAASAFSQRTPKRLVGVLPSDYAFDAPVAGLAPARVYRARLHFYRAVPGKALVKGKVIATTTYSPLGVASEWYYSATKGSGLLEDARLDLLLDGFFQLSESDRGRIGYRGTAAPDGTRFYAGPKERWCSEFYTWLASAQFHQISIYSTVSGVWWWFVSEAQYHPGFEAIAEVGERADWIPVDTDGDGDANHSTMFLAYDPSIGKVWTLEGNDGNYVSVRSRALGAPLQGVGHLTTNALAILHLVGGL